jgi:formylglycine-generating enzyme
MKMIDDPAAPGPAPHAGMSWIPARTFRMGSDAHYSEEAPAHNVSVSGFWIDRYPVTNRDFARFVRSTRHVTLAEQVPAAEEYPDARPELLVAGSSVFVQPDHPVSLNSPYAWWTWIPGADWRHPQGPGTSIQRKPDHPVVHLAWTDVEAYARWAGKQVPAEAEWELAARGGLDGAEYAWGDEFTPGGRWMANTWQGEFPVRNAGKHGRTGTSPVGQYPANGYGLYDMIGNVWEWTSDWYQPHSHASPAPPCCSPAGPGSHESSAEPAGRPHIPRKVMKGGSHLCAPNYCRRYRPAARMPQAVDTSTSHLGFRLISRPA